MRQQKCRDPANFCDACNGFGVIARLPNVGGMAEMEAMIKAGYGDKPVEVVETECPQCQGTGERLTFPKRQLN